MIIVKHFAVKAGFFELLRTPVHVSWVKLDGLQINAPPKGANAPAQKAKHHTHLANFVIDQVDADGTELYVLRKVPKEGAHAVRYSHANAA